MSSLLHITRVVFTVVKTIAGRALTDVVDSILEFCMSALSHIGDVK